MLDASLRAEFIQEAKDSLQAIEGDILTLEKQPTAGCLDRVFRAVHTIKGAAGFCGLAKVIELSTAQEGVLSKLREGKLPLSADLASALLASLDILADLLNEKDCDISPYLEALSQKRKISAEADKGKENSLRVDLKVLDRLVNLASELVLTRNQLKAAVKEGDTNHITLASDFLDGLISKVQTQILATRMQPLGGLFQRCERLVHDLAQKLGKDVRFEVSGSGTQLDKTVIDALKEPLLHLLRNCIDHGIEHSGTVSIRASYEQDSACIVVSDNGRGIDPEKIAQKALSLGLVRADELATLTTLQKQHLIFKPGFSTASAITEISGRGVGLDVVHTQISAVGGRVELVSAPGFGTQFCIHIPLTLAIMPAVLFELEDSVFAILQMHIAELVRIGPEQMKTAIQQLGKQHVLHLRGTVLPLLRLKELLAIPEWTFVHPITQERLPDRRRLITDRRRLEHSLIPQANHPLRKSIKDRREGFYSSLNILVVQVAGKLVAVLVDRVLDAEEVVLKALGPDLAKACLYSSACILGDGRVAMILDPLALVAKAGFEAGEAAPVVTSTAAVQPYLLCQHGPSERLALPLSEIGRICPLASSAIRKASSWTTVVDGRVVTLLNLVGLAPLPVQQGYMLLLLAGTDSGLLVTDVEDIISLSNCPDRQLIAIQNKEVLCFASLLSHLHACA